MSMDAFLLKYIFIELLLNSVCINVVGAIRCYYDGPNNGYYTEYIYCQTSCCGSQRLPSCCDKHPGISVLSGLGIALGVLVAFSAFICIICCRRRRAAQGQVMTSQQQAHGMVFIQNGNINHAYSGTAHPSYPGNVYSGYPGSVNPGYNGTGSYPPTMAPQELNAGTLSPPPYESVARTPAEEPPQYSTIP